MSYVSGSEGPSVSGYDVQGPKALPASAFASANAVSCSVIHKNPTSVVIIGSGSFHFLYSSTQAEGAAVAAAGIPTLEIEGLASGSEASIELPISPCAWSGSGGTAADQTVVFVYKYGK